MSNSRRSSLDNIDAWLDKCPNDERDSILEDPDFAYISIRERTESTTQAVESLYKTVFDICSQIGLPRGILLERMNDIDECLATYVRDLKRDVQSEFENLCSYKEKLLNDVKKMTTDLYLPQCEEDKNADLTLLQRCKRLKVEFNKLNSVREKRMNRLRELREAQAALCSALSIEPPNFKTKTDIPTEDELFLFSSAVSDLEKEKKHRISKFEMLKKIIIERSQLLEITPHDLEQPDYSQSSLKRMENIYSKLEADYKANEGRHKKYMDRLMSLYKRLDTPLEERDAFFLTHDTCKPSLLAEMEAEIQRCEDLKKENIDKFIITTKADLIEENETCFMRDPAMCESYFSTLEQKAQGEELLELYEKEMQRLKMYREDNAVFVDKFSQWIKIIGKLQELEKRARDPSRFNNRGGQLLAESRLRKSIDVRLPKLEEELKNLNIAEKEKNGQSFKVFGENMEEFIKGLHEEINGLKEHEKRERQKAKSTPAKTNQRMPLKATPARRPTGGVRLLGALSLSEQEFESMAIVRPTSAKRHAARNKDR